MISTYPVRTSKERYTIPLLRRHVCSMGCYVCIYQDEATGMLQIQPNPNYNGMCEYTDTYEWSLALISDPVNWHDIERLDEVVVPDSSFFFTLSFPLQNPRTITVTNRDRYSGFTRRDILNIIRAFYEETYNRESATATQTDIEITMECGSCAVITVEDEIETVDVDKTEETCSICLETLQGICGKLQCGHYYHRACIFGWTDTGRTNCPMCRTDIINCADCNGDKVVRTTYSAAVPDRRTVPFGERQRTDGEYGVYSYYLEDLALQGIVYDRSEKRLNIEVCPMYQ